MHARRSHTLIHPLILLGSLIFSPLLFAGEWHVGESLKCGECHVEHGVRGGVPIPGGPYSTLLLKGSVNELCLSCHDGSDPASPDVLAPVTMYNQTIAAQSAGGYLQSVGVLNTAGHSLGISSPIPLSNHAGSVSLNCASCHDYHGNSNYRNLRYDPGQTGDSVSIVAAVDLFWQNAPADPPNASATVAAYAQGNIGYKSGWNAWCGSCHSQVKTNTVASLPAHFNSHPSDIAMNASFGKLHVDIPHWIAGTGEGFAGNSSVPGEGIIRLPFSQPTATDFQSTQFVLSTNKVTCISCHQSHGGEYGTALRWPYVEGGVNYLSGCQQCHNR